MGVISNGVKEIKINDDILGFTEEDSVNRIVNDNSTETPLNVEEKDLPIYVRRTASKTSGFEFTIADPDVEAIQTLLNAKEETEDPDVLELEDGESYVLNEASFELTPDMGWGFKCDDCTITSQFTDNVGKNSFMGLRVTVMFNGKFSVFKSEGSGN